MRASLTSIRLRHVGHFHEVGPGGGLVARVLVLGALLDTCAGRLALHSAHKPRPMSKPLIDVRDLQPTQYCVVRRSLPLPTSLTIAALTVWRLTNAESQTTAMGLRNPRTLAVPRSIVWVARLQFVETDADGRVTLPGHARTRFLLRENADGSILLQPAHVLTEAQYEYDAMPELRELLSAATSSKTVRRTRHHLS